MHPSRNRFRGSTGDSDEPRSEPHRAATSTGFYHRTPSTSNSRSASCILLADQTTNPEAHPSPHIGLPGATFESELGSGAGGLSLFPTERRNSSEELSRTKNNAEGKTKRFHGFKFSFTASPPKSKPKQPSQSPPPVRVGGRGGAGNIKRVAQDKPAAVSPASLDNQKGKTTPTSIEGSRARQPLPDGETTDPEYRSSCLLPGGREVAIPRLKPATSGRGGAGNLHNHVLEDGVFKRVIDHEDSLIRYRRETEPDKVARRTGRGGVGNVKRSDDDPDLEHSSSRSGSAGSRGLRGRGARISTSTRNSGTTSSSGASVDIQMSVPDTATHPNFQLLTPPPDEEHGPLSSVLEQRNADIPSAHLRSVGSPVHRMYASPPGATTGNIGSEGVSGRVGPRSLSPPHLYLPHDHPLRSQESGDDGRRRFFGTKRMAASRPQDGPALDGPGGHVYSRSWRMSPPQETPLSSPSRHPQYPVHPTPSQRGFEETVFHQFGVMAGPGDRAASAQTAHYSYQTTLASPTIVPLPTPSTEAPPSRSSGGAKGPGPCVADGSHLRSDPKRPGVDWVRESRVNEDHRVDPNFVSQSQEEGRNAPYSDLFEGRMGTVLETDSVNTSGAGTPFSDQSSILVPRRASPNAPSSTSKRTQGRPVNPYFAGVPYIPRTKYTSRPRSQAEEEPLHCDELDMPPHKSLSKMEKAILRRVEFGQNVDFSRIQLS